MAVKMYFVKNPKTGRSTSCDVLPNGKCKFSDGTIVDQDEVISAFEFSRFENLMCLGMFIGFALILIKLFLG